MTADHQARIAGMLADPDLVGELLLVGIAFARSIDLDEPSCADGTLPTGDIAEAIYGRAWHPPTIAHFGWAHIPRVTDSGRKRLHDVLHSDIRRYRPTDVWSRVTCGRPMIQRDGLCDRAASHTEQLTDPATGERNWVGACSNRACRAWLTAVRDANRQRLAEYPPPIPPANAGGVLARHLDEIDWLALWGNLDSAWSPPPEVEALPGRRLRLIVSDEDAVEPADGMGRPALMVLPGGWR